MQARQLAIITGAGASTAFGLDGKPIPMMSGWSEDLRRRLGPYLSKIVGLTANMPGPAFEERIGAFLRCVAGLPSVLPFGDLGLTEMSADRASIQSWFGQAQTSMNEIQGYIFASLHQLFALSQFNLQGVEKAWGTVLANCPSETVAVATTNYDPSIEVALKRLRRRPFAGEDINYESTSENSVNVEGIIDRPNSTPVLYLHGRVGWYENSNGELIALPPSTPYNVSSGRPALLLPDPNKAYGDGVASVIWEQFRTALGGADRVLVIGHSLADDAVAEELRQIQPGKVGVCMYAPDDEDRAKTLRSMADQIRERLRNRVGCIPLTFGPTPVVGWEEWQQWIRAETSHDSSYPALVPFPSSG